MMNLVLWGCMFIHTYGLTGFTLQVSVPAPKAPAVASRRRKGSAAWSQPLRKKTCWKHQFTEVQVGSFQMTLKSPPTILDCKT